MGRVRAALAAVVALLSIVSPVLADPAVPDALEVRSAFVCRDLLEADDMLVAVHYNILYDPTAKPTQTAGELFLVRLMDGGTELGVVTPYSYYNSGYDQGIVALYFSAADAPTWGDPYTVTLQGTPAAWATPPTTSLVLGPANYSGLSGQAENQAALYGWMIDAIESLESNWSVTLLESSEEGAILDETGQTYMTGAIPGLQALCPPLFWIQAVDMDTTPRAWGTGQADLYEARFDGTWVGDGIDAVADLFHVTPQLLGGLFLVLLPFIGLVIICERTFHTSTPALILLPVLMGMAAVLGFLSLMVLALVVISFVLFVGYVLFFRTS